jgi:plasmid stability protein
MLSFFDSMAQILVRNLDDAVVDRLKLRAEAKGTSLEQEARTILTEASGMSRAEVAKHLEEFRARQKRSRRSVVEDIREDRDR